MPPDLNTRAGKNSRFRHTLRFFREVAENTLDNPRAKCYIKQALIHKAHARVVELADSLDSGSSVHSGRAGSSPASRTKTPGASAPGVFCCLRASENAEKAPRGCRGLDSSAFCDRQIIPCLICKRLPLIVFTVGDFIYNIMRYTICINLTLQFRKFALLTHDAP